MCGRFSLAKDARALADFFPSFEAIMQLAPRYNIAPTQPVVAVLNDRRHKMDLLQWGLIPPWAREPDKNAGQINARAETLTEKPTFKHAFRRKRCLIPADGFFEWKRVRYPPGKQAYYIRRKDGSPFMMAGLWEEWHDPTGGLLMTCTIITTRPNALMEGIHDRMPVILPAEHFETWISPDIDRSDILEPLLVPAPDDAWEAIPVSPHVNDVRHDDRACVVPYSPPPPPQLELDFS